MKKTILLYILCLLLGASHATYAQINESAEFSAKKGCSFFPIGESGEFVYYCNSQYTRDNSVKIFIEKFRTSDLSFVETKEISPKDFITEDIAKGKTIGNLSVALKNHEFRIIFSLSTKTETWIYAKVIDEKFTKERNIEIGTFKELERGGGRDIAISTSNDGSKVLFAFEKSFHKATQAIGGKFESRYHTEYLAYDWASNKVLFTKTLPEELNGLILRSENHIIDNNGNAFFLAKLSEKRDDLDILRGLAIGLLEASKKDCSLKTIDMAGFERFSPGLHYLDNENILFIADAESKVKMLSVSLSDPKSNFEKTFNFSANSKPETAVTLKRISFFKDEIYLTFVEKFIKDYYSTSRVFVVNMSNSGNITWEKDIPMKISSYYKSSANLKSPIDDSGKLNVFYEENIKDDKAMNKKYETILATIDRDGKVTKQTVNTNEKIQVEGSQSITTKNGDVIVLIKRYTEKKMILTKILSKK